MNNVNYLRYAESARIVWFKNFARLDVDNRERWEELWTPRGQGLILKLIRVDYKFVSRSWLASVLCRATPPRAGFVCRC